MKKNDFKKEVKEIANTINESNENKERNSAIKNILKRFKAGKISLERAEYLINKINDAFNKPSNKKSSFKNSYVSSCSPPSRNC